MHEGLKDTVLRTLSPSCFLRFDADDGRITPPFYSGPSPVPEAGAIFFGHVETLHPLTHGACCPALVLPVRHADDVCSGGKADMTTPGNNFSLLIPNCEAFMNVLPVSDVFLTVAITSVAFLTEIAFFILIGMI